MLGMPKAKQKTGLTLSRLTTAVLLAGVAAFAGLYLASIGPYWNISPDSSSYVGWGRSLAAGAGWGSPPINPPLTAFVFAAVLRIFPSGYLALNALTPLLILLALGFAYLLVERRAGRNVALLVILLSLAATPLYRASTQLLSEPVYMVCSLAALYLLDGYPSRGNASVPGAGGVESPLRTWLAGLLLLAAALTRTIGVALALAVLLVQAIAWLRERRQPRFVLTGFALAALASVPLWQAYSGRGYASGWFRMFVLRDPWTPSAGSLSATDLFARVLDNLALLPRTGGMLLNGWARDSAALHLVLQAAGLLAICWGLLRALRQRVGVTELYLGLYTLVVTAHLLAGGGADYRFMIPVAPLLFYYAIDAARQLARMLTRPSPVRAGSRVLGGLAALFLFGYLRIGWDRATRGVAEAHYSPFGESLIKRPENFDLQRLAFWLKRHSRPEDRYAAAQRSMLTVLSERRGEDVLLVHTHPRDAFVARLAERDVRYLLVDRGNRPLGDSLLAVVRAYPASFRLVWELPAALLYEVTAKRQE